MSRSILSAGLFRARVLAFLVGFLCVAVGSASAQDATTTTLSATTDAVLGTAATLTATVADVPNSGTVPTGTVFFYEGSPTTGVVLGSSPVNNVTGVATFMTSVLALGAHTINAAYVSDTPGSFINSDSTQAPASTQTQKITARSTSTLVTTLSPNSVPIGALSNVTVTVTDALNGGSAGTFASDHALDAARSAHASALLPNGSVLISGGEDNTSTVLQTAETYDPVNGSTATGNLVEFRAFHSATRLPDGTILIIGGTNNGSNSGALQTAEIYSGGTFTTVGGDTTCGGGTSAHCLAFARYGHTATLLADGRVLIAGGNGADGKPRNDTEVYDPTSQTFSAGPAAMHDPRYQATASLLPNGKILFAGGDATGKSAEIYDPAGSTILTGNLNNDRFGHVAAVMPDGVVFIAGGKSGGVAVNSVELYDSVTGTFALISATMSANRANASSTVLNDATIAIIGGIDETPTALSSVVSYTPSYDPVGAVTIASDNGGSSGDAIVGCTLSLTGTGVGTCSDASVNPRHVGSGSHKITASYSYPDWTSGTTYTSNNGLTRASLILPTDQNGGHQNGGGFIFEATTGGTSDVTTEPTFPQTLGGTVLDPLGTGTLTWTNAGLPNQNHSTSSDTTGQTLTVTPFTPVVKIFDAGNHDVTNATATYPYNATPQGVTATVTGIDGDPLTITSITYDGSATAPTHVKTSGGGLYAVVATFTSSNPDYANATGNASEQINAATPTVKVFDASNNDVTNGTATYTYNAAPQGVTATVTGFGSDSLSITTITYDGSATAPTHVKTTGGGLYAVVATFTSSNPDYKDASANASEQINAATPTVKIFDASNNDVTNGTATYTYNATSQGVTATVTGFGSDSLSITTITYDGSATAPTNVKTTGGGLYTVVATFTSSNPDYKNASANASEKINAATPTVMVSFNPASLTYDANAHAALVAVTGVNNTPLTGTDGTVAITYLNGGNPSGTPTNAGSYTATAAFNSTNGNYTNQPTSNTATLNISKATPIVTVTDARPAYDGTPKTSAATTTAIGVTGAPVSGSFTFTYDGTATPPTNIKIIGNMPAPYAVVATFTSTDANYVTTTVANGNLTITQAAPKVAVAADPQLTYDGNPHAASATAIGADGVTPVSGNLSFTYDGSVTPPTNVKLVAGSVSAYAVVATFTSTDANYQSITTANGFLTIKPATPTVVTSFSPASLTYDANAHAASVAVTGVNNTPLTGADGTVAITYMNGANTSGTPINVGSYTATATFTSTNGNYNSQTSNTASLTIGKATPMVVVSFSPATLTYDTNAHPVSVAVTGVNNTPLTGADGTVAITYMNGANTSGTPINVGSYTATATFTSTNGNYNSPVTSNTASLAIGKATPTVTFTDPQPTYNATAQTVTPGVNGVGGVAVSGTFSITYDGSATAPTNVKPGAYAVLATFTSTDTNYMNSSTTGTLTIKPATPTVTVAADPQPTFNGSAHTTTATANGVGGVAVPGTFTFTYDGSASPTNVKPGGAYSVVATFTSSDTNYSNTNGNGALTIKPATPTVVVTDPQPTYSAAPQNAAVAAVGVGGAMVSGTFSFTYDGSATAPTNVKPGGAYAVVAMFTSADTNYTNSSGNGTLTVNKATSKSTVQALAATNKSTVTFNATVSPVSSGIPTGTVTFMDCTGASFTTCTPISTGVSGASATQTLFGGTATFPSSQLAAGQHLIKAIYSGDTNFVAPMPTSVFGANVTEGAAITVSQGGNSSPSVTLSNSLSSAVQYTGLQCVIVDSLGQTVANITCSMTSSSVTVPSQVGAVPGSASIGVQIVTKSGAAQPAPSQAGVRKLGLGTLGLTLPAILFLPFAAAEQTRKRWLCRKKSAWIGLGIMLLFLLISMGCGGGGFNNPNNSLQPGASANSGATPLGSYVIGVTGVSSAAPGQTTQVASIPLTVSF